MKTDQTTLDALMARNPDLARRNRRQPQQHQPTPENVPPINLEGEDLEESKIQDLIEAYFRRLGLEFDRAPMHKKSLKPLGWPDFTVGIPSPTGPQAWAFEVKTRTGKVDDDQVKRHKAMRKSGGWHVVVVRSLGEVQTIVEDVMWGEKIQRTKIER